MARVRIKDHDRHPELSIAVVVAAALLIWFTCALWTSESAVRATQRPLSDVAVVFQCNADHRFEGWAGVGSRPCSISGCESRAWPMWSYQCSKDGASLYQLRYTIDGDNRPRIKAARPVQGSWQEVADEISCAHCGRAMVPDYALRLGALDDASSQKAAHTGSTGEQAPGS